MKERVILHSDLNNFYASVECLYHPEHRGKPLAILGDPEARHGIVLAKNYEAKAYDVQTGDPMWMAQKKCPDIVFVPPHYDLYMKHSKLIREIYSEYTDVVLWQFANGLDTSPVSNIGAKSLIKTVGNSTTAPRDLVTDEDIKITLMVLSESVSARLREYGFICRTVQIGIRDNELEWFERQGKLEIPNRTAKSIFELAFSLFKKHTNGKPIRSLSVRACDLKPMDFVQLSLLPDVAKLQKQEELEAAMDNLRNRFGHFSVQKGMMLNDKELSNLDPKNDHIIHPMSFFN